MNQAGHTPKISIIIPTYNRADLIGQTIQAVIDQTYPDWELIIVDDASTDQTPEVAAQFKNERILYLPSSIKLGVNAARNKGFSCARGELISFLDSDDLMLPHNLEVLVKLLESRPEVDVAYGWYYWMEWNGDYLAWNTPKIAGEIPPQLDKPWPDLDTQPVGPTMEGQILSRLVLEETFMLGSALVRRECVEKIGGFDQSVIFQEHWDYYLRLARAGCTYACCRQAVARWRQHPGNRGLNKDGMLVNRLALLDRLFNDPGFENILKEVRLQAYYNTYITYYKEYTRLDFPEKALDCLRKAVGHLPDNSESIVEIARTILTVYYQSTAKASEDPLTFASKLFHPAQDLRLRSRVLGQISADLAFRCQQEGAKKRVWRHVLEAVRQDSSWLKNRGLIRIGFESLMNVGSR